MIFSKYWIISFCCETNNGQFLISVIAFTKSLNNLVNLAPIIFFLSAYISDYIFSFFSFFSFFSLFSYFSLILLFLPLLFFLLFKFFSSLAIILNRFLIYFFLIFLFSFFKKLYLAPTCFLLALFNLCRSSSTSINPRREKYFEL